jgi:hypothetical protein
MWPFRCTSIQTTVEYELVDFPRLVVLEVRKQSSLFYPLGGGRKRWDQVRAVIQEAVLDGVDAAPCRAVYDGVVSFDIMDDLPSLTKFLDGCEQ